MSHTSTGGAPERRFERRFPPEPVSAPAARLFIDEIGWEDDIDTRRRLAAAVSEVVTNSILHARTDFSVEVTVRDDRIRVGVRDESPQLPSRQLYESLQPTGRGLLILDEMADRWGYSPDGSGKTVWFEIERRRASVDH
jgi:anti-sigma regulatory factor (Ser/Thr protein kinase)